MENSTKLFSVNYRGKKHTITIKDSAKKKYEIIGGILSTVIISASLYIMYVALWTGGFR